MKWIRLNIKNQLILYFVTLTVVSLLVNAIIVSGEVEKQTKLDYSKAVDKELTQISAGIENYLFLIMENTAMIANNPIMQNLASNITSYVAKGDPSGEVAMTPEKNSQTEQSVYRLFQNFQMTHDEIETVSLGVQENGGFVQYPATARFNGYDARKRDWYKLAAANPDKPILSDVYISSNGSKNIVSMSAIKNENGNLLGVVTMNINLDQLTKTVGEISIGKDGYVVLVDENGMILVNTRTPETISKNIAELGIEQLKDYKNLNEAIEVKMPDGNIYSVNAKHHSDSKIGLNWSYITFIQTSEYRITANRIKEISILCILGFALLSAIITVIATKNIIKPITILTKHLQKIGEGDFTEELNSRYLSYKDEVGEIARSTKKMQSSLKDMVEHIQYLAYHDSLTKLPNRMYFQNTLTEKLNSKSTGAVFLLDIDNFKGINDTMGHFVGDILLKQIAERLTSLLDEKLFAARLGGDEFLVLLSNTKSLMEIDMYAKKIKEVCAKPFLLQEKESHISFSMGITLYPDDSDNIDQLLMNADTAMYKIKRGGKNSYIYYNEKMQSEILTKKQTEEMLRSALKEDGFQLFYQPLVDSKTGYIVSFEALLRLKKYTVSPSVYIPTAEECGIIIDIGRWVVKEAIEQMAEWRALGFRLKPVAINFSSIQLRDTGFIDYICELLQENQLPPECLEIEITEGILLENNNQTIAFLQRLKEVGIQISLDDFGTGYSSLSYLTFMPIDKIKLDKSIIDKFLNLDNGKVINRLTSLIHSFGFKVTAEGVENWKSFKKLRNNGCEYIQGYLFSKPLPENEIKKIYDSNLIEIVRPNRRLKASDKKYNPL